MLFSIKVLTDAEGEEGPEGDRANRLWKMVPLKVHMFMIFSWFMLSVWNYQSYGSLCPFLPPVRPFARSFISPHSTDFDVELWAINYVHPVRLSRLLHKLHDVPTGAVQISQNFPGGKKLTVEINSSGGVVLANWTVLLVWSAEVKALKAIE